MLELSSAEKRDRASSLTLGAPLPPIPGGLDVQWERPFDRLCYDVAASGLARKHRERFDALLAPLIAGTGCSEAEILSHGQKVRSMLYFAEDRMGRQGLLGRLGSKEQMPYHLSPVTMAF